MQLSLSKKELKEYIGRQLSTFFPDKYRFKGHDIDVAFDNALDKMEYCFKHTNFKHYNIGGEVHFTHLYSDQYSQLLYWLSREIWLYSENKPISGKLVMLNRTLNGFFCPYTVKLPDIFLLIHPQGTIIGNANFSDYLVILQNVTINNSLDSNNLEQLNIGKGVFLSSGCKIIGSQPIGDYSSIGVNTVIHNIEVPHDSVAYTNRDGKFIIVPRKRDCKAQEFFLPFS